MATRKKTIKNTTGRKPNKNGVKSYKHSSEKRFVIPTEQTSKFMKPKKKEPIKFSPKTRKKSSDVKLCWDRELGLEQETFNATPFYIHEKIHPMAFIHSLTDNLHRQATLFGDYDGELGDKKYSFYTHKGNWQNRIIRGNSQEVMATLIEKENMGGSVKMIYFDPPYGQDFSAMLQVSSKKLDQKGVPIDPLTIKAFRDTYSNDVHSYLDNIYRTLVLARNTLAENGSLFLQINSNNVHYIAAILDEVFGFENRVRIITYVTTGGGSSNILPDATSYILWYAKDAKKIKPHKLYEEKTGAELIEFLTSYAMVEKEDKTIRNLTDKERKNPKRIPKKERLFRRFPIVSQTTSNTGRSNDYYCKSMKRTFKCPENSHWSVSDKGLDKLDELGRLVAVEGGELGYRKYADEIPGKHINNLWATQMSATDKHYVVETAESVIERCILMATDPGDLVYDPTCGSGTTALMAEKWGRRWITSDVSAISTTLTRQRIATGVFQYYHLLDSDEGWKLEEKNREKYSFPKLGTHNGKFNNDPSKGFIIKKIPEITAGNLAYEKNEEITEIVDKPEVENGKKRVSSPFTVETMSPYKYEEPDALIKRAKEDGTYQYVRETVLDALEKSGVINIDGEKIIATSIEAFIHGKCLTHTCMIGKQKYAILIAPPDCTIPIEMIRRAEHQAAEFENINGLMVIGFNYEDTARRNKKYKKGDFEILLVNASMDMQIKGLSNKKDDSTLMLVAEPSIKVHHDIKNNKISLEIEGYQSYDPETNQLKVGTKDEIVCWMVDTDFDGESFFVNLLHFPKMGDDKQVDNFRKRLKTRIDEKLWERTLSTRSRWFKKPKKNSVAVRIITNTNMEMSTVLEQDTDLKPPDT